MPTPPKLLISYSHDSEAHAQRVRDLADRLCADGLDCALDQYEDAPPQGWILWMDEQVESADFVLVVATETYRRRASGRERPGVGRGVRFESVSIVQDLYDAGMWNEKFIPVLLDGASPELIIKPLRAYSHYRPDTDDGYEALYRRLTKQPRVVKPELGTLRVLPPDSPPLCPTSARGARLWSTFVMSTRSWKAGTAAFSSPSTRSSAWKTASATAGPRPICSTSSAPPATC